jgi:hypothetical protein
MSFAAPKKRNKEMNSSINVCINKEDDYMRRKWDGIVKPVIAFAIALALVIAAPIPDGAAKAVDLDKDCSLTVIKPLEGELKEQLADVELAVDLYKIADAEQIKGSDGYKFSLAAPYAGLSLENIDTAEAQVELEQAVADIAIGKSAPAATGIVGEKISGLEAGLYLAVTRGAELDTPEDYMTTVTKVLGDNETKETSIATIAYSESSVFTFEPQLVSVPTKGADEENGLITAEKIVRTSDEGKWNYEITTVLKASVEPRFGSLEIIKSLLTFEKLENGDADPATFVFDVEAYAPSGEQDVENGRNVYSNVVSLTFTSAGQKSVLVENIPIGSTVIVKEVYSGANYVQVSADPEPVVIQADEIVSTAFTNDYDDTRRGGGSLTNHFDYEETTSEDGTVSAGSWNWTQPEDNSSN